MYKCLNPRNAIKIESKGIIFGLDQNFYEFIIPNNSNISNYSIFSPGFRKIFLNNDTNYGDINGSGGELRNFMMKNFQVFKVILI